MQDLPITENKGAQEQPQHISLWSRSGPLLLLGAFAIFLFKCAPMYWPLTLTAFLGYATTRLWKKGGLILSLIALGSVGILILRSSPEPLWTMVLIASIACSWLLIYLGGVDAEALALSREQRIDALGKEGMRLENERSKAHIAFLEGQRQKQQFSDQITALESDLSHMRQAWEASEKERNALSQDVQTSQRVLGDTQQQLTQLKSQLAVASIEENSAEEEPKLHQVQCQFALLREQFEEKSGALDQARKELFRTENELLALQKAWEEKDHEPSEETISLIRDLNGLEMECREMENQILFLQDFISSLLSPKKRVSRSKKSKESAEQQELLPELIQAKIDETLIDDRP